MKEECEVEANYKDCGEKTHLEWVDDCCLDLHEFRILQLLRKDFFYCSLTQGRGQNIFWMS